MAARDCAIEYKRKRIHRSCRRKKCLKTFKALLIKIFNYFNFFSCKHSQEISLKYFIKKSCATDNEQKYFNNSNTFLKNILKYKFAYTWSSNILQQKNIILISRVPEVAWKLNIFSGRKIFDLFIYFCMHVVEFGLSCGFHVILFQ